MAWYNKAEDVFVEETEYKRSYYTKEIKAPIINPTKPTPRTGKRRVLQNLPLKLNDVQTLTPYKTTRIDFSLSHRPKPIVGEDPRNVQEKYEVEQSSEDKKQLSMAIKTRPRVLMPCGNGIDDVDNPKAREILIGTMYLSSTAAFMKQGITKCSTETVVTPLPQKYTCANPIRPPKLSEPYVSPEWRMQTASYDNKNWRLYCDSTKMFWMSRGKK